MISRDYIFVCGKYQFAFPKDTHPNSKRSVVCNGFTLGICPTDDLATANQIARLIVRAIALTNRWEGES
jgi:hypothetical protein